MISRKIRLLIIGLYAVLAITFLLSDIVSGGIFFIIAMLLNIYNLIRYGSINVSLRYMKKNNLEKTRKYLNETTNVDWLSSTYKGYYYWIKAFVKTGEKDLSKAVKCYEKALDYGLRTENDRAIIYLQLALLSGIAGKFDIARDFLRQGKQLRIKSELLRKIEEIEEVLEKQKSSDENLMLSYLN